MYDETLPLPSLRGAMCCTLQVSAEENGKAIQGKTCFSPSPSARPGRSAPRSAAGPEPKSRLRPPLPCHSLSRAAFEKPLLARSRQRPAQPRRLQEGRWRLAVEPLVPAWSRRLQESRARPGRRWPPPARAWQLQRPQGLLQQRAWQGRHGPLRAQLQELPAARPQLLHQSACLRQPQQQETRARLRPHQGIRQGRQ